MHDVGSRYRASLQVVLGIDFDLGKGADGHLHVLEYYAWVGLGSLIYNPQ